MKSDKNHFKDSNFVLFASLDILEKSIDNKNHLIKIDEEKPRKSFWGIINPFKCGNY